MSQSTTNSHIMYWKSCNLLLYFLQECEKLHKNVIALKLMVKITKNKKLNVLCNVNKIAKSKLQNYSPTNAIFYLNIYSKIFCNPIFSLIEAHLRKSATKFYNFYGYIKVHNLTTNSIPASSFEYLRTRCKTKHSTSSSPASEGISSASRVEGTKHRRVLAEIM